LPTTRNQTPEIDVFLARRLVSEQFPHWSGLSVEPVEFSGWDNRTFHLGDGMLVRLPSAAAYAEQVEKEQRWLPELAPLLPLSIPSPLAMGTPAGGYPWNWSVYTWLQGQPATRQGIQNLEQFATALGEFLAALQRIDAIQGPRPGPHNFYRGGPLLTYDADTRRALAALSDEIDANTATALWESASTTARRAPPVWLHGDVSPGNLLVERGRLSAVIDFGCSGVGDPACDLVMAWSFFDQQSRHAFFRALRPDDETVARGRGWALWKAAIILAGHCEGDTHESRRTLEEVLADYRSMGQ
jgi:aminoglycoside phosphotransferase (APT) family kinase protein